MEYNVGMGKNGGNKKSSRAVEGAAVLPESFFARPAAAVARDLLGMYIVRRVGRKTMALHITETESYGGASDLASHASRGRTARTEVMFGPPGRFYIYLVYGMHYMINVVTGKDGAASAVLLRGTEEVSGPGSLARALSVDKSLNCKPAAPVSGMWFEDRGRRRGKVIRAPRVGVSYAGPVWSAKKLRFISVSK